NGCPVPHTLLSSRSRPMRNSILVAAALVCLVAGFARSQQQPASQPPAAADPLNDAVNQKAAKLEAELSQMRDTSPETAPLMLQLVDLYYSDARVFGLIRVAERFVATQSQAPQGSDVMLKLLDGLVATSRNKEIASTCRQFLSRYPEHKDCGRVEVILTKSLE